MVNSLKHRNILTIHDIQGFRKEIAEAMPDSDKSVRAKALSSVVTKQLDNCLYGIEIPKRDIIKKDLLSDFLQTYEPVTYHNMMEKIIIHSNEPQMVSYLDRWLVLSAGIRIPETTLSGAVREIKENLKKEIILSSLGHVDPYQEKSDEVLPEAFFNPDQERRGPIYRLRIGVLLGYVACLVVGVLLFQHFNLSATTLTQSLPTFKKRVDFVQYSKILSVKSFDHYSELHNIVVEVYNADTNGIPPYLRYRDFDRMKLLDFLEQKNSMLTQQAYFNTIIRSAKRHDLNPLLLFAISGQEQGFVPRNTKHLQKIINNPYNVYHSWQKYNTTLKDSTDIAAETIVEVLDSRQRGEDPFKCINLRYAEDDNWWRGTKIIFNQLSSLTRSD